MEGFANEGGMISEQLWDAEDRPEKELWRGKPTGAAMPLCWSHAEYLSLVRSVHDGVCFDRVEPAFQRYVADPVKITHEMWSTRHPILRMPKGRLLRLIIEAEASILWTTNDGADTIETNATHIGALNLWFADLATQDYPVGTVLKFRFRGKDLRATESINYSVTVGESR
jgi:glucoamylase